MTEKVQRENLIAAQEMLSRVFPVTPLLRSPLLSNLLTKARGENSDVFLKCENVQRTGSFKARGAYWMVHQLSREVRERGLVAASAGNHAQGVALAARKLGAKATVVMPKTVALPKKEATEKYLGHEVQLTGDTVQEAIAEAESIEKDRALRLVHPYNNADVIAGQGTVGLEIAEQCPEVKTVVVPVGGGGLAAGIAVALADHESTPKIVGVQAEACAAYKVSLLAGKPTKITKCGPTIADGIAVQKPGRIPFDILKKSRFSVQTVSEETLYTALLLCLERAKQLAEPAGVAAFGALLEHIDEFEPPVVVVLSGGNIDPLLLADLLRHSVSMANRDLNLRCRLADRPRALAELLQEVGSKGANVIDVTLQRVSPELHFHEVDALLQLETKGKTHNDEIDDYLQRKGFMLPEVGRRAP